MEWMDDGIVLGTRRHGEGNAIVELITRAHGRHLGMVRGGAGSRLRPVLQPGNVLRVVWRARLDEHLGTFSVEALNLRAGALLGIAHAMYAVTHVAALVRLLPERDPHEAIFETVDTILDHLDDPIEAAARLVRFELHMLSELGFGLDLTSCAATGTTEDLVYVSPKSGRAVSRQAGEAWHDKLLLLPAFLREDVVEFPAPAEIADAFALTAFFLTRHALEPRRLDLSEARAHFIAAVLRKPAA
ncbi:MAG TPA: DNA repair protein RecO [Xanthobacteraceae bacterium]|nr:DNA repair protein RecO [Xanthobacteraceae bacterium]